MAAQRVTQSGGESFTGEANNSKAETSGSTNEAFLDDSDVDDSPSHPKPGRSSIEQENSANAGREHGNNDEAVSMGGVGVADGSRVEKLTVPVGKVLLTEATMSVIDVHGAEQQEQYAIKQQEIRDRDPLLFCRWITERPALFFGVTVVGHALFIIITMILYRTGYDIIPIEFDRLPLDIRNDVDYLRALAWQKRNTDSSIISRYADNPTNTSERTLVGELLVMVFMKPQGNVFTKENLMLMQEVEDDFYKNPEFQSTFCQLDDKGACTKPRSILRYFDGTYKNYDNTFNDPNFNNIAAVMYRASQHNSTKQRMQYHLGKKSKISTTAATSDITRWQLYIGVPLKGYANRTDRASQQSTEIEAFIKKNFKPKAEDYYRSDVGKMQFIYFSGLLLGLSIKIQVFKDMALALGSLVFIITFVCIQTGSIWVGLLAIFSIIASFTEANIIYRAVLDYRYFGIFHVLAIFIILGIGCDDVFVFFDTWKDSSHYSYKSLGHRLSDCYRKASLAMLFTSLTTSIAFAISAASPFLAVSSFGIFSCILVLVNYISVIVFFPCVVITYHMWWERYSCLCFCPKKTASGNNIEQQRRKNIIVRFFAGPYFRFITHRVIRWFILLFFGCLLSVSIYFASTLRVNEEQVEFLPKSSNFGKYISIRSEFASTSEFGSKLLLVWGLKPQDLSSCHKTESKCTGKTVWDDNFQMNTAHTQQTLLALCKDLKALDAAQTDSLAIRRSLLDGTPEVQCFADAMKGFYQDESKRIFPGMFTPYPAGSSFTYPIEAAQMQTIMAAGTNLQVYNNASSLPQDFNSYFEVATSFWLFNGFRFKSNGLDIGRQLSAYNQYIGEAETPHTVKKAFGNSGNSYKYGTRLRYIAVIINMTIDGSNFGYPKGLPIRDRWEDYITRQMAILPDALKGGFQILVSNRLPSVWHWFKTQKTLAETAMIGIGISIGVSCPILVVATQNVFVGFLATLTICCITCSVIGIIPLLGWKLGLLESLNLVLVVGLAVDYVVHLAEGYSRAIFKDRKRRTQSALEEVGISIISGAVTTLGASVFLLGAFILFFTEFGIFMFSTIGFSMLYALGMFTTLIAIIGPQGETGSLKPLWRWCSARCKRTSKESNGTPAVESTVTEADAGNGSNDDQKY